MGYSSAACAVTGVPVEVNAAALLVYRSRGGRWAPYTLSTWVALDEYQDIGILDDEGAPLLTAAAMLFPDSESPLEALRDQRIGQSPVAGPGGVEVSLALIDSQVFHGVIAQAKKRLAPTTDGLLLRAFQRAGLRAPYASCEPFNEHLRFCAALEDLELPLDPFRSFGDVSRGDREHPDVADAFEKALRRLSKFTELARSLKGARDEWESGDDEDEDQDDEPGDPEDDRPPAAFSCVRSFIGTFTVRLERPAAAELGKALADGASEWNRLHILPPATPEYPAATLRETGGGFFTLNIGDAERSELARAMRSGSSWAPEGGSVQFKVS